MNTVLHVHNYFTRDAAFEESKHPRDEQGHFKNGGYSLKNKQMVENKHARYEIHKGDKHVGHYEQATRYEYYKKPGQSSRVMSAMRNVTRHSADNYSIPGAQDQGGRVFIAPTKNTTRAEVLNKFAEQHMARNAAPKGEVA